MSAHDRNGGDHILSNVIHNFGRLAYLTPSNQFPTGGVMPLARRLEWLQFAARHDTLLLEDDYDSEYRYEGAPFPSLQGQDAAGRVI